MKEIKGHIHYNDLDYPLAFTLNVMEEIQEEYGTIDKWGELTSGEEPSAKAVIFGFWAMINEGIDIENETAEVKRDFVTKKQVGRIITEHGLAESTLALHDTVAKSVESAEKNE